MKKLIALLMTLALLLCAASALAEPFTFTTTDLDGITVTDADVFTGSGIVILNMWEPWCGPCVGEMPDLELLYQNYKDKGLLIVGAFATPDSDEDARAVLEYTGVTYPILHSTEAFFQFDSGYVPTTVVLDGSGNVLSPELLVGARPYDAWEQIVLQYLK